MSEQPEQPGRSPGRPHLFTLSEAATACGVSRSRIRRMLDAGEFPNAVQEDVPGKGTSARVWHVPSTDLLAAGLVPNREANRPADEGRGEGDLSEQAPGQALQDLQHALDLEREKRKAAESIAAERERTIEGLERALRLLEARNPTAPEPGEPVTPRQGTQDPTAGNPTGDIGEGPAGAPAAPGESVSWWARLRARMGG